MAWQPEASTESSFKPHVVAIPFPAPGHINPLMELSKQLAAKGFTITFVNTEHYHLRIVRSQTQLVQSQTQAFVPFLKDQGLDIRLMGIPDGLPLDHSRTASIREIIEVATSPKMETGVEELMQTLMDRNPPITCLISDMRLTFTQDVANNFGIPRVAFWTQSAASYASNLLVSNGYRPPADDTTLITCIPGVPPHKRSEVTPFLTSDPSDLQFQYAVRPFQRSGEAVRIVINTFDELESIAMEALRKDGKILTMGPCLPSAFFSNSLDTKKGLALWPENYKCLDWLDSHPPASVLYISFSTLSVVSAEHLEEIALGLEASQQPFLWVLRPDLMSGNSTYFPDFFLHRLKDRAMIVPWAPQLQVLSHPSVGGFLTHCGWNSIVESMSRGVPMLGWPKFADQKLNLRCVVDAWRIGLSMEADENGFVTRVEVEKKVRELMQGEQGREVRDTVGKLREAATRAMAEGGSSYTNFELLAGWLMEESSCVKMKAS